jgi:diaminohydroxyphosphoribosylaminopyrimidine deaminase/5-amino-6-(5-phosphoribosylamino)uracil reductase
MERALALALDHRTHPNPRVGAVIIDRDGRVLAEGAHTGPGNHHAEIEALARLEGDLPPGSTMVVTLEPCNHHGRTPPCAEALIAARLDRVVVGALDPDPRVAGAGIARLEAHGIEVESGVLADAVEGADPAYFYHRRKGRPLVTLKTASTLDGQTAARDGTSQWITSPEARVDAHRLRAGADCVVIGAGTLRADDPQLTVRGDNDTGDQPVGVVVAGDRPLPSEARLWLRPDTLVLSTRRVVVPAENVVVSADSVGRPDPAAVLFALGERGYLAVLVEGGARLAASFWAAGLVDVGVSYLGAKLAGGAGTTVFDGPWNTLGDAVSVAVTDVKQVGPDVRITWTVENPPSQE